MQTAELHHDLDTHPNPEVERLLAQVAEQEANLDSNVRRGVSRDNSRTQKADARPQIHPHDFRLPSFLSAAELRKLRIEHESFLQSLTGRLSNYLRLDINVEMLRFEPVTFKKFSDGIAGTTHMTMFKADPLRGTCLLEMSPQLGRIIADRLMGGTGHPVIAERELSDIEIALLDQAVKIIIGEWCAQWVKFGELRPTLLGHESNIRFLQILTPDTLVFLLSLELRIGDSLEQIQICFPYTTLEPLIQHSAAKPAPAPAETQIKNLPQPKWKPELGDIRVPVTAECPPISLTARALAALKVGDVLQWASDTADSIQLRVANVPKFGGQLGTRSNKWAIEITETIKSKV